MSNDEFLLSLVKTIIEAPVKPLNGEVMFYFSLSVFLCVFIIILALAGFSASLNGDCHLFFIGIIIVFILAAGYGTFYCGQKAQVCQKQYRQEMVQYELDCIEYDQKIAEQKQYNKDLLEVRKTYTIYLDGQEVSYNSVLFTNYKTYVDDEAQTIYLSQKD